MKDNEKKVNKTEEEAKKEVQTEEKGVKLPKGVSIGEDGISPVQTQAWFGTQK